MRALLLSLTVLAAAQPIIHVHAAEPPAVRGTVTDEQGRPQPDVLVLAISRGANSAANGSWSTRTDAQGQFEFKDNFPSGQRLFFNALKHGWYADSVLVSPEATPRGTMTFILKPAQTRTVSILDVEGKPCATAAVVQLEYTSIASQFVYLAELLREFPFPLDASGKVVVDILPPGDALLSITVETPAAGTQIARFPGRGTEFTLRLRPVGSLSGRFVAPNGLSAASIELRISTYDAEALAGSAVTAVTDEQGEFSVGKLAVGRARILPQIDPSRPVRMPIPRIAPTVEIVAGKEAQIDVELQKAVRVTGTILSRDDNKPIAGAKVVPSDTFGQQVQNEAITDEQGRYSLFFDSPNVRVRVEDAPPPFYPSVGTRLMRGAPPGAALDVIELPAMYLSRGIDRKGTVLDENGNAAAGAWVTATWPEVNDGLFGRGAGRGLFGGPGRTATDSRTARTDAEGRLTLQCVAATADLLVRAATEDRAGIVYTAVAPGDNDPIRLTVVPDAITTVAGRVVNREGNPIVGVSVEISILDGWSSDMKRPAYDHKRAWKLTTDAAGHYETRIPAHIDAPGTALGSTRYMIYARSPTAGGTGQLLELRGGEAQVDVPDFVLPPMRPGK